MAKRYIKNVEKFFLTKKQKSDTLVRTVKQFSFTQQNSRKGGDSVEHRIYVTRLYDCYAALLTPKQQNIFEAYFFNDYSLSEIAEQLSITKQGVRDSLQKTESLLIEYEEKLGHDHKKEALGKIVEKFIEQVQKIPCSDTIKKELDDFVNKIDTIL